MLRRLANFSIRHRWLVIAAWVIALAAVALTAANIGGSFTNNLSVAGTDSQAAHDALSERFPEMAGAGLQVVIHDANGVDGAQVRDAVEQSLADVSAQSGVEAVVSPYGNPPFISADGATAVATVSFTGLVNDLDAAQVQAAQDSFGPVRNLGVQVEFGGPAMGQQASPSGTEIIGLAAAVVVLLVAFGSVFAMLVPLLSALLALGVGMGAIFLLSNVVTIGTAGPVVAAMIGLGVGIDYALLVVTRHREGLAANMPVEESIATALSTAGRSVLVAGTTVIVAILSLYAIGIPFVATLGLASAITVAASLVAAVTLLPALLAVFGGALDRFRVRRAPTDAGNLHVSRWYLWTRHVQRHPWRYLVASITVLVAMAFPLLHMQLGTADNGSAPQGSTERAAYDLVAASFGPGWTGPLLVTAEFPTGQPAAESQSAALALRQQILPIDGVAQVAPPALNSSGDTAVLTVVPTSSPQDRETEDLVHALRAGALDGSPATVHVGGQTATSIDLADRLGQRIPWFIAFVVGLSMILLLVEFRSILIPVKAALMNLLSVGAAYGAVVAVFQWGWLSGLLGQHTGPIESFAPVMLFAVLFGLSMDYEVFLLSRVYEVYGRTGHADEAVAKGIAATARVITAAASVMVVVFASFMLNDQRVVNLFGFGLAVAIAVDATVVRMVVVPAVMTVLGRAIWYLPDWLGRLLPRVGQHQEPGAGTHEDAEDSSRAYRSAAAAGD